MSAVDEPSERAQKESAGACGGSKLLTDESVFGVITHTHTHRVTVLSPRAYTHVCVLSTRVFAFF